MFSLVDRKAIVTGASQGLGEGFALALAGQGADIALIHLERTDEDRASAKRVQMRISRLGRRGLVIQAD
ncbi:MAG: oxidoreductase, partial [Vicinamibacteria bacterium]